MQVISRTHVGRVRSNNEDALLLRSPDIFAVADGMGGYAAGEIASRATVKAFEAATHPLRHVHTGEGEDLTEKVGIEYILLEACAKANAHVYKMAQDNAQYREMGTTLTALYIAGDGTAYVAHIGDSRLYLAGEELVQVTRDHSLVQEMVRLGEMDEGVLTCITHDQSVVGALLQEGKITSEEAFIHPKRNMLLQALGVEEKVDPELCHFSLAAGDQILLCSDGLSDMVRDEEIAAILTEADGEKAADKLLDAALDNGGKDNVSFILLRDIVGLAPSEGGGESE